MYLDLSFRVKCESRPGSVLVCRLLNSSVWFSANIPVVQCEYLIGMSAYLATGARTDCRNIIEMFAKLNTMRYHEFTEIWRNLKFPYIYYGHSCLEELIEFTEEVLRIAKEMWLKSEGLNEQAGGLYLLYGLYLKQPTDGLVKVRLTPRDYELMKKFHEEVKAGDHHDANYILARMHIIGAFRFCISEFSYGLEKCYRVYHESDKSLVEVKDEPIYIKRLKNDAIFHKLEDVFKQYHNSKCKLVSENSKNPPQLLSYVDSHFSQKLKGQFQKITQRQDDDDDDDGDDSSSKSQEMDIEVSQDTAKEGVENRSVSKLSKFKLPWWMVPVRNRKQKESSSESEGEDDADCTSQILDRNRTIHKNTREALNVALGMSGDEEEEEDGEDNEKLQRLKDIAEAGSSHDMPILL